MRRREFGALVGGLGGGLLGVPWPAHAAGAWSLKATSGRPVYFRGWQYKTDIVQSNVTRYNTTMNGHVNYATVTGDYPSIMEQMLMSGAELDVLYGNPSQAVHYFEGNWVAPADELPDFDQIKADFLPNLWDAWTYKGKLLGLSYFATTRGTIHVNLKAYGAAGMSDKDFPKSWDELYDQVFALHAKGVSTPFLPHWFSDWYGISWAFVFEVLNRGGKIADDETHKPLLTTDKSGPAYKTLAAWKKLWNAKFVPAEILTYDEAAFIEAYGSGRYVFSPQQLYDLQTFNDKTKSRIAGYDSLLPVQGQSWGLIDSALYMMTKRKRSHAVTDDVQRFTSWYGFKDQDGKIAVGERWMAVSMLFSAYRSIMDSPSTEARIKQAVARPSDYKVVLDIYEATPFPSGVWKVVWAPEYNSWLKDTLSSFLLQNGDIESLIRASNKKITELNDKYGI
jgi:ABC-type glycerol-3-phosphate transport system substrate-binding protein